MSLYTRLKNRRGFTIIEMVVTVAVLAILVSISTPAIYQYMNRKDQQDEDTRLKEINKALEAYLTDKGELPSSALTGVADADRWYSKLSAYTNLSAKQVQKDVWGRDHRYILYTPSVPMYGTNLNVNYVTIFSSGLNGIAEKTSATPSGIALDSASKPAYADPTASDWWNKVVGSEIDLFSKLQTGGDDHIVRFTDYTETMDKYKATMERMDKISQSLEVYAKNGYARRINDCTSTLHKNKLWCGVNTDGSSNNLPETTVYYPCFEPTDSTTECASTNYYVYDGGTAASVSTLGKNSTSGDTRTTHMVKLMQTLGLPAEYCCSAMDTYVSGGIRKPTPFYYFPNPRPRTSSGCDVRPGQGATKLPARITTQDATAACG